MHLREVVLENCQDQTRYPTIRDHHRHFFLGIHRLFVYVDIGIIRLFYFKKAKNIIFYMKNILGIQESKPFVTNVTVGYNHTDR